MFKKTPPPQIDMFKDLTSQLSDRKTSILDDPASWHNVFFREVAQRVDESVFEPLFLEGGRPNSPLRVLLAMMVLKEGNGWSDEQLYDNCRSNYALHEGARPVPHRRRRSGGIHLLRVPQEAGRIQFGTWHGPCRGGFPLRRARTDKGAQYQGGEDPYGLQADPVRHSQDRPSGTGP